MFCAANLKLQAVIRPSASAAWNASVAATSNTRAATARKTIAGGKVEGDAATRTAAQRTAPPSTSARPRASRTTRARATASRSRGATEGTKRLMSVGPPSAIAIELTVTTVRASANTP
jgi:hypothetical protein